MKGLKKENLSNDAIIITIGKVIVKISELVLGLILVRLLTKNDYGSYRQVWLIYATLSGILLLGIPASIYYFVPTLTEEKKRTFIFQTVILLACIGFVMAGLIAIFSSSISAYFNNSSLRFYLRVFSVYILFSLGLAYFENYLFAEKKVRLMTFISLITRIVFVVCVVVSLLIDKRLSVAFTAMGVFMAVQYLACLIYVWIDLRPVPTFFDRKLLAEQFRYALPLGVSSTIWMLGRNIDKIVISLHFNPELFAVFAVGAIELPLFALLNTSVNTVLRVKFAELYKKKELNELVRIWHSSIKKQALIYFPIFFYFFILADPFITLFYTEQYRESVLFFRIYLFLVPLRVATYSLILTATGRTRPVMYGAVGYLLFNGIASVLSIKIFGIAGPAAVTVLSTVLVSLYYLMVEKHYLDLRFLDLFPIGMLAKLMGYTAATALFLFPIKMLAISNIITLIVGAVWFGFLYIVMCINFSLFEPRERQLIKDWVTLRPILGR